MIVIADLKHLLDGFAKDGTDRPELNALDQAAQIGGNDNQGSRSGQPVEGHRLAVGAGVNLHLWC